MNDPKIKLSVLINEFMSTYSDPEKFKQKDLMQNFLEKNPNFNENTVRQAILIWRKKKGFIKGKNFNLSNNQNLFKALVDVCSMEINEKIKIKFIKEIITKMEEVILKKQTKE